MYDLHSHLLPGIDDGAPDCDTSLAMARAYVDQGVKCVACTPHILPGLYHNSGPQIKAAVAELQRRLDAASIPLKLVAGADNHIIPDFVAGLREGRLLPIGDSSATSWWNLPTTLLQRGSKTFSLAFFSAATCRS